MASEAQSVSSEPDVPERDSHLTEMPSPRRATDRAPLGTGQANMGSRSGTSVSKQQSVPNHAWLRGPAAWRRDMNFMERLLAELPDYIDSIPEEARDETVARIRRLRDRIDSFEEELARAGSHTGGLK